MPAERISTVGGTFPSGAGPDHSHATRPTERLHLPNVGAWNSRRSSTWHELRSLSLPRRLKAKSFGYIAGGPLTERGLELTSPAGYEGESRMSEDLWRQFDDDDGFEDFAVDIRDRALFLLGEADLDAQLLAIRSMLRRNKQADEVMIADIDDLKSAIRNARGAYAQHLQDQWLDRLHGSVFQDAAHSMTAAVMIVPFVESLFVSIFNSLRMHGEINKITSSHSAYTSAKKFWDPHYAESHGQLTKGSLVDGIMRLSNATGLATCLPYDLKTILTALFSYRNKVFHHGFEWPKCEREKFYTRIAEEDWADWFSYSSSDGRPWIIYMHTSFIEYCLTAIDKILEGVGEYLKIQSDTNS